MTAAKTSKRRRVVGLSWRLPGGYELVRVARQQLSRPLGKDNCTADGEGHAVQEVSPGDAAVQAEIAIGHTRCPSCSVPRSDLMSPSSNAKSRMPATSP